VAGTSAPARTARAGTPASDAVVGRTGRCGFVSRWRRWMSETPADPEELPA
jgi:hypothetical protein